jgi:hypothetical protein
MMAKVLKYLDYCITVYQGWQLDAEHGTDCPKYLAPRPDFPL